MNISHDKVAAITYTLKSNNAQGDIIESIEASKPVEFIFGKGSLLPHFEHQLTGLKSGDSFEFVIPSHEAYGAFNNDLIIELSKDIFSHNGVVNEQILFVGSQIPMMDSHGRRMNGVVKEVSGQQVKMDFNHPLAGQDLYFAGQVTMVRDATYDELNPPKHHGCGCGSGPADESCCSTSGHDHDHDHDHNHGDDHGCGCGNGSCGC